MPLSLTRRPGQSLDLSRSPVLGEGDAVDVQLLSHARIRIQRVRNGAVTLVIEAAESVQILRGEAANPSAKIDGS